MKKQKRKHPSAFSVSWRDTLITLLIFACACLICSFLRLFFGDEDGYVPMIFILAVMVISRSTTGYLYGIIASLVGTVIANVVYTYPFYALNFSLAGYPLCFGIMLAASIFTCALTSRFKRAEQERAETEQETMRANLLRAVSHDLRTPLTSILGATNAVLENQEALDPQQTRSLLKDVRDDAQWLIRIVENLLSITRIDGSAARLHTEPELGEEILAETVQKFRKQHPSMKILVSVPEEPLFIPMDATLIEQVLLNLMENAVQHGHGTTEIDLTLENIDASARFTVRDNGSGIERDTLPHLFENYFTNSDNTRNMGIGLSVCRTIIHAHHGDITARNNKHGGASFTFTLPLESK